MTHSNAQTVSPWMDTVRITGPAALTQDVVADVCVVGAGIAGLSTAYLLALEGRSVVVLEASGVGAGQTQRTTAHLSNALDDRYYWIEEVHGLEAARLAAESHTAAIDRIAAIVAAEEIACDFELVDGYLFPAPGQMIDDLKKEHDAACRAGLKTVELIPSPLGACWEGPCLRFPCQGQFHPLRYLAGLTLAFSRRGGRIFTAAHVKRVQGGHPAHVETEAGPTVACTAVVVATNTPINDLIAIHTKQAAYITYVIAAPVPAGSMPRGLFWDDGNPYHYVRLQSSPADSVSPSSELLIIGGEDHKTGQETRPEEHFLRLESWARPHFPLMGAVQYAWSGQCMETVDGLAYIGRNPLDHPNVFIATGDSGMGMTHGTIAGMLLTDLIQGRENRWEKLYDPSRMTVGAVREYARENINVAWQYTDWLTPGEVSSADEVPANSGAILRNGLRKLAVYRDDCGQVHQCSAICPHLGCIVRWNDAEKTWDCPCHGSRYNACGRVINGPAVSDLTFSE